MVLTFTTRDDVKNGPLVKFSGDLLTMHDKEFPQANIKFIHDYFSTFYLT